MPEGRKPLRRVVAYPGVWLALHGAKTLANIYFRMVSGLVYRLYIRGC